MKNLFLLITLQFFCITMSAQGTIKRNISKDNPSSIQQPSVNSSPSKKSSKQGTSTSLHDPLDNYVNKYFLGEHLLSLQYISWTDFGKINISRAGNGLYKCHGAQYSKINSDYIKIDGLLEIIDVNHLVFTGTVAIKIREQGEQEFVTNGTLNFEAKSRSHFWRAWQTRYESNGNPHSDYIDIFFKSSAPNAK